jgi:hypothetical protein
MVVLSGCAMVRPDRHFEEATPVDWGLAGAYLSSAVVVPFDAKEPGQWGAYAANRLAAYLRETGAFRQVVVSGEGGQQAGYIVRGSIDHLFYGADTGPTEVFLSVQVVGASDSKVRFLRTARVSLRKRAFHMVWLRSVPVDQPYLEEVLGGMLKHIGDDIASRTLSPAVQNP